MSVFEQYHRSVDRRRFWARLPVVLLAVSLIVGVGWSAAAAVFSPSDRGSTAGSTVVGAGTATPSPQAPDSTGALPLDTAHADAAAGAGGGAAGGGAPQQSGEPGVGTEGPASATEPPAPVVDPDPADDALASWRVEVATTGHQAEVDRCIWVRMDVGASAPIVGAHNDCGGGIVLEMALGDTVTLVGEGVDGTYTVTGEGSGYGGQNAAEATAGLTADVILQTCFLSGGGHARLLALTRVPSP